MTSPQTEISIINMTQNYSYTIKRTQGLLWEKQAKENISLEGSLSIPTTPMVQRGQLGPYGQTLAVITC